MKLVSVAEMRQIEAEADDRGWTYAQMMERAGLELAKVVQGYERWPEQPVVTGLVGTGNNGGDTLVALAALAGWGWKTQAYLIQSRRQDDPLAQRLLAAGGQLGEAACDPDFTLLDAWLSTATIVLDGVLGTGCKLPLRPDPARVLGHARRATKLRVVAVDCPSGVDCDSGDAAVECLPAELTVCMAAAKVGLVKLPAFSLAGQIRVVDIGLPDGLESWEGARRELVDEGRIRALLPRRPLDGHKGVFGTLVVAGGCLDYPGAPLLAGKAAARMGVGLVREAVAEPLWGALVPQFSEAVWTLLPHQQGVLNGPAAAALREALPRADALLVGPGLGLADSATGFFRDLLMDAATLPPMVVDADGLKHLARISGWATLLPPETVLTPHPGEMAVLTELNTAAIQSERLEIAQAFARRWGHVVVLKGAFSVVAAPEGRVGVIPAATTALAHAGTGDVLAGMIAALRAQGLPAYEAALSGAFLHAQAGLEAERRVGHAAAVLAGDVIEALPWVLKRVWR